MVATHNSDGQTDVHNMSVKESLMNTHKNPMITPTPNGDGYHHDDHT